MKRKKKESVTLLACMFLGSSLSVYSQNDTIHTTKNYRIDEVVVTGTRSETDIRHLPMTVSVVGRKQIEDSYQPSLLPTLVQQVPGLFITGRGVMGYGVSDGAAGSMNLRGIGGAAGMLILIDGHPQYMGLMGIRSLMLISRCWPNGWKYYVARLLSFMVQMRWVVLSTLLPERYNRTE